MGGYNSADDLIRLYLFFLPFQMYDAFKALTIPYVAHRRAVTCPVHL